MYKETSYLYRAVNDNLIKTRKEFLIEFIYSLIYHVVKEDTKHLVTRHATPVGNVKTVIHLDQTQ